MANSDGGTSFFPPPCTEHQVSPEVEINIRPLANAHLKHHAFKISKCTGQNKNTTLTLHV